MSLSPFALYFYPVLSSLIIGVTFTPNSKFRKFLHDEPYLAIVALMITIVSLLALVCKRNNLRKVPWNYILLFTFTCAISYDLAFIASFTGSAIVIIAAVMTLIIVFGATVYAWKSKDNFTRMGYFLYEIVPLCIGLLILGIIYPKMIITGLISAAIAFIFSIHLTFDIKRLIGKFEVKYTVDDYILAALDIYIDIYIIFVELFQLVQTFANN